MESSSTKVDPNSKIILRFNFTMCKLHPTQGHSHVFESEEAQSPNANFGPFLTKKVGGPKTTFATVRWITKSSGTLKCPKVH